MNALTKNIANFWAARQPREKTMLLTLVVCLAAALLAQALWTSHNARARLKKQIPQLVQQLEGVQRKAAELQQLKRQPPLLAPADGPALIAAATSAARVARLPQIAPLLQLEGPRRMRLRASVPFDRWLEWTAMLQRDGQGRLVSVRIEAGAEPGSVNIDALYALPEPT